MSTQDLPLIDSLIETLNYKRLGHSVYTYTVNSIPSEYCTVCYANSNIKFLPFSHLFVLKDSINWCRELGCRMAEVTSICNENVCFE